MNLVIRFDAEGNGKCLWSDEIPLYLLGSLKVSRASSIEHNDALGRWEVRLASDPGSIAYYHQSRLACLEWEVGHLNNQLMKGSA